MYYVPRLSSYRNIRVLLLLLLLDLSIALVLNDNY